jgi:two-component system response regulator AtoC
MSAAVQAKLLRVLEERQVQRLGALRPKAIDVRFVAASHKDLQDEVDANRFREDLYFRLNGITVEIPPLRERVDDIEALALSFLAEGAKRIGKAPPTLAPLALQKLRAHPWPGNVRELRTVIERAVVLSAGASVVDADHIALNAARAKAASTSAASSTPAASSTSTSTPAAPAHLSAAERAERERIIQALHDAAGNQTRAAELLGVSRRTLINRIEQYDVPRPRKSEQARAICIDAARVAIGTGATRRSPTQPTLQRRRHPRRRRRRPRRRRGCRSARTRASRRRGPPPARGRRR